MSKGFGFWVSEVSKEVIEEEEFRDSFKGTLCKAEDFTVIRNA